MLIVPSVNNTRRTVPANILPYNLKATDIILANTHTISSNHINNDITISNIFAKNHIG